MKPDREAMREFVSRLKAAPDPWLVPMGDRLADPVAGPVRTLLLAVLGQNQAPVPLAALIAALEETFGSDLPRVGQLPWDRVVAGCTAVTRRHAWNHAEKLPSILLAVSDFLARHPDLHDLLRRVGPSDFVKEIASGIGFTGRSSPWRERPWRLARWLARGETGLAPLPGCIPHLKVPPATVGRALKFLELPVPEHELPVKAWDWSDRICQALSPDDPAAVWVPFLLLRRPRKRLWACQDHLGGCADCPVLAACRPPSRE